jgi:hypothetical protein
MNHPRGIIMPAEANPGLRRLVLVFALIETAAFLFYFVGGLLDVLPFAKGYGGPAAFLAALVFVPLTLPALIFAWLGRSLPMALVLLVIGGLIYAYDPLLRLGANLGGLPVTLLYALGLAALAGGGYWYLRKT